MRREERWGGFGHECSIGEEEGYEEEGTEE